MMFKNPQLMKSANYEISKFGSMLVDQKINESTNQKLTKSLTDLKKPDIVEVKEVDREFEELK